MNAIVAEKDPDNVTELRTPGPGERLRNARLAADVELAKMAEKLHLTGDMVDALECDDYSEMPARVFVRGYVRNYARLVELPEASILTQFDELWPEESDALKVDHAPRLASDTKPGGGIWGGLLTWLLVLGGAALFLLWWLGHLDGLMSAGKTGKTEQPQAEVVAESSVVPAAPGHPPGALVLPKPEVQLEMIAPATAISDEQPESPALEVPQVVAAKPPAPTTAAIAESVPPVPSADASAASTAPAESSREVAAAPVALPQPQAEVTPEAPHAPVVKIAFREDCWVDIRSADRKFRLFGTMRKGAVRTLGGKAPYRMTLGNVSAVDLSIDGKDFDLAPHTRENIARLTLSP